MFLRKHTTRESEATVLLKPDFLRIDAWIKYLVSFKI
jgi:hypothetical protein